MGISLNPELHRQGLGKPRRWAIAKRLGFPVHHHYNGTIIGIYRSPRPYQVKSSSLAQTISYAELGKKAMRADTIAGICSTLEISADYLLFGDITPEELSALERKISQLPTEQCHCLENIIDSFITAVTFDKNKA